MAVAVVVEEVAVAVAVVVGEVVAVDGVGEAVDRGVGEEGEADSRTSYGPGSDGAARGACPSPEETRDRPDRSLRRPVTCTKRTPRAAVARSAACGPYWEDFPPCSLPYRADNIHP